MTPSNLPHQNDSNRIDPRNPLAIRNPLPVPLQMVEGSSISEIACLLTGGFSFLDRTFTFTLTDVQQVEELVDERSLESLGVPLAPSQRTDFASVPQFPCSGSGSKVKKKTTRQAGLYSCRLQLHWRR
jgi:hypothetical protein